jgi:serine protease Do
MIATRRRGALLGLGLLAAVCTTAGAQALPDFSAQVAGERAVVVSITSISVETPFIADPDDPVLGAASPAPARRQPMSSGAARVQRSLASGFIVSAEGHIVTSAHAVSTRHAMTVRLADGREFVGRLVGADEPSDVALLKVDASGLTSARIGDPATLAVGSWVTAMGAPFGLETSLTAGIVSAKRLLPESGGFVFLQTDVAINPGSSGSPLFNLAGEVVGMNSMVYTSSGGYMGVSFAMPIDLVMGVVEELRSQGRVVRGQLGLSIQELTVGLAHAFGVPGAGVHGALVSRVRRGAMAERAGVRLGDVILGFGGRSDMSYDEIQRGIEAKRAGERVALNIWRGGAVKRIDVEVTARATPPALSPPPLAREAIGDRLGLVLASQTPRPLVPGDDGSGIEIVEAHGAALRAGLGAGDRILALNDLPIRSVTDYDRALARLPSGAIAALLIERDGLRRYFALATTNER